MRLPLNPHIPTSYACACGYAIVACHHPLSCCTHGLVPRKKFSWNAISTLGTPYTIVLGQSMKTVKSLHMKYYGTFVTVTPKIPLLSHTKFCASKWVCGM